MLTDDLLALQDLDSHLGRLANRRRRLDEHAAHAAASERLAAATQRLSGIGARLTELAMAVDEAEAASEQLAAARRRLEAQLRTVIAPREAEALNSELATLAAKQDALDDAELANLEEQTELDTERLAAEAELPDLAADASAAAEALAAAEAEIEAEADTVLDRRDELAATIDAAALADYMARRERFDGVAISRLDGARCGGCHLDLSTAEREQVVATGAGEPADCPQCGRMLVA